MADQTLDVSDPYRHGSFSGQTCVVTGGSQGLGNAVAQLMKARGAQNIMLVGRDQAKGCLLYTSPSPRDLSTSRMPSSA